MVARLDVRPLLVLEVPAEERGEAVGLVLQIADLHEVRDAIARRVDGAVHHRRARTQAHLVRDAHHAEPLLARALGLRDLAPHAVDEDLGAAAGHAVEPRSAQALEHLPRR